MYVMEYGLPKDYLGDTKRYRYNFWLFRLGMLMIGAPLGAYIGYAINPADSDLSIMAGMIFMSGIFWVIEFFIEKKIIDKHA
jgi:hypothetical protein